jgi:hypothetical protein
MEAARSNEKLFTKQTACFHCSEDHNLNLHHRENFKLHTRKNVSWVIKIHNPAVMTVYLNLPRLKDKLCPNSRVVYEVNCTLLSFLQFLLRNAKFGSLKTLSLFVLAQGAYCIASSINLGTTTLPIQWLPGVFPRVGKERREADNRSPWAEMKHA